MSQMMNRRWRLARTAQWCSYAAIVALLGCLEASGPQLGFAERLESLMPANLTGEPGFPLSEPVRVRVVDNRGRGVPDERVSFTVTEGGGAVDPASALTDSTGLATATWRLGPVAGTNTLKVSYGESSVTLRASSAESRGVTIVRVSGGSNPSPAAAGCALSEPLVVRVTDGAGRVVAGASVGFEVRAGGGTVTPTVATTDANGLARATWSVGYEGPANQVDAVLRTSARPAASFTATSVPAAPGGYSVIGNQIIDPSTCRAVRFHGVTRPSLEWTPGGDERFAQIAQDWTNIKAWGANIVRLPVSQVFWLPGLRQYDPSYKPRVVDAVKKARALGFAVVIDLHASDRGDPQYAGVPEGQQMPDLRNSLPFWRDVAATFKNDGGVIFELYNEPHEVTWDVWLNGGDIAAGPRYPGGPFGDAYRAVGMQQLYDAVRSEGARNLVMVSGTHWGYFLNRVPEYRVKGYNIVYASHPYDWPDKQPDTWESAFGTLAATDPVIISEFGAYDCTRLSFYQSVLDFADRKGMSWIAWAWWTPPPVGAGNTAQQRAEAICRFPALITDWNGTPSASGALIRQRLATYR